MSVSIRDIDCGALSPAEKMELADVLYDVAQQELDGSLPPLTDEQMREIDQRIADADTGHSVSEPWDQVHERLQRQR